MAYKKKDLEEQALKAIKKNKIARISYLIPHIECSEATFYNHKLEQLESIKDALQAQRIARKTKLVKKWEDSENATLNIAAFKLLADEEELQRLSNERKGEEENKGITVIIEDARSKDTGND